MIADFTGRPDGQAPIATRPDVVPARPARARQRGAVPRAASLPAGALRLRLRHARSSTPLPRPDRRVEFIRESLVAAGRSAARAGRRRRRPDRAPRARPRTRLPRLARALGVQAVFANHDYEPQALARDAQVRGALADAGIAFHTFKDQVIFERDELLTQAGQALHGVHALQECLAGEGRRLLPEALPGASATPTRWRRARRPAARRCRRWRTLGFEPTNLRRAGDPDRQPAAARALFDDFLAAHRPLRRDARLPGRARARATWACTCASARCRSAQLAGAAHALARQGDAGAATWLSELIWRDFYFQVLANFPHVATRRQRSFKPRVRRASQWEHGKHAEALFAAWCEGRTGYPLVDAAMAQINQTGYMHNRLRMVVASFLCKDLGIDWRRGERYFARAAERLRPGVQQRRLAVGQLERLRCAALLPHLQPGEPEPNASIPRASSSGATCRSWRAADARAPRAVDGHAGGTGGGGRDAGQRLPAADRRPRRGARAHPAALRGGEEQQRPEALAWQRRARWLQAQAGIRPRLPALQ